MKVAYYITGAITKLSQITPEICIVNFKKNCKTDVCHDKRKGHFRDDRDPVVISTTPTTFATPTTTLMEAVTGRMQQYKALEFH